VATSAGSVRRSVLPGGLRVLSEPVPGARSVAFGIWIGVGSRDERAQVAGASHFLEHLLFKGTQRRDALEIAEALDAVGGESNAFTGREYTCFYARVLDDDLPLAVDVVVDQVLDSVLDRDDVEAEREVILEEIAMHDDDSSDVVHDAFALALFGDTPLGRPVLGSVDTVAAMSRTSIARWYRSRYALPSMVVAAAGSVDHDLLEALVQSAVERSGATARRDDDTQPAPLRPTSRPPTGHSTVALHDRDTEQVNLVLGTTALRRDDPRRPALHVLTNALGGGTSSRLFQEVREERGLAYSVYASTAAYADTGTFEVYAGCTPGKVDEVLALVREQLADVAAHGLSDAEVVRSKGALRGSTVLDLEDTGSRMTRLGKAALVHEELLSPDQLLDRIAAVTPEHVQAVAADVLTRPLALGAIGPLADHDLRQAIR
jgi:predicted Zn-dependent peptidase